jgi:acyl-CoA reductase-like NAD-dependent aldehyde dehydrogenase
MNLEVHSPYSGELVARLAMQSAEEVKDRVRVAAAAQQTWGARTVDERITAVERALRYFEENAERVAQDVSLQMGKPLSEARGEVRTMLARAAHMLEIAAPSLAADVLETGPSTRRRIEHVPLGVVLNIAAWNYPLMIPVNVVVPALLAGNSVLLKHSARTPLCGQHFQRAFAELENGGLVQDLILDHAATAAMIQNSKVATVAFTGSVAGGRQVQAAARSRFIPVGLELGGKDPAYVAEDADLDFTVPSVVEGACYNAGQSCCAIERVYVHRRLYDEFLDRAKQLLADYRPGDPLAAGTTLGPMATRSSLGELESQVRDAVQRGARLLLGGTPQEGRFFAPTLLADCTQESEVMQEESFGPLLPVQPVEDDGEALARMNDSRYGLTASVWSQDLERGETFAAALEAGTVFLNRADYLDPALPWTGVKDSGRGATLSQYGFHHLTQLKSVALRLPAG